MSRLYVLGAGGDIPTLHRQTSSYLVEGRRGPVLFDAGTGLSRLDDPLFREMVGRSKRAWVLLGSCAHGRIAGLPWLPSLLPGLEVTVGVPPKCRPAVERLLKKPYLPRGRDAWEGDLATFRIVELQPGENDFFGEVVDVRLLSGPEPTCAFRVREVCYATGCPAREETAALAARASVLVHDAYLDSADLESQPALGESHATAAAAARLAAEAGVKDLVLAHLNPAHEPGRIERLQFEATATFPRSVVATDMGCIKMSGVPEEESDEESEDETDALPEGAEIDGADAIHP